MYHDQYKAADSKVWKIAFTQHHQTFIHGYDYIKLACMCLCHAKGTMIESNSMLLHLVLKHYLVI